jgi:hypothetical protein
MLLPKVRLSNARKSYHDMHAQWRMSPQTLQGSTVSTYAESTRPPPSPPTVRPPSLASELCLHAPSND